MAPAPWEIFAPWADKTWGKRGDDYEALKDAYVSTEHLLLGLMKEGQSIAAKILESLGARLDEVRVLAAADSVRADSALTVFIGEPPFARIGPCLAAAGSLCAFPAGASARRRRPRTSTR